ncbi:MAG: hypothetical protein HLUCCO18_11370 [Rhodobacteraceae bacterium HLUCCO18]|nr:MAG: hypothetical protein HLUCCO18_11370 [Rhodobacteraceae bacterium HLUCCO18]
MKSALLVFSSGETGAITVDWVVLSAAAVGMALAVITLVAGGSNQSSLQTSDVLSGYEIDDEFDTR